MLIRARRLPLLVCLFFVIAVQNAAPRAQPAGTTAQKPSSLPASARKSAKKRPPFRWVNPLPDGKYPGVTHQTFTSPSMKRDVGYCIYLPPGYADRDQADRRYPVVYYLHGGRPGNETKSVGLTETMHQAIVGGLVPPMIYVFVNGGAVSHYNYPARDSLGEDVFVRELIPHIDGKYRTVPRREGRGIEGFSQGGRGTTRIMFKHPHLFCSAAPGGAGHATEKRISEQGGRESAQLKFAEGDNTYDLARRYAKHPHPPLKILVHVGTQGFNYENNLAYMRFLDSLEIAYQKLIVPGVPHSARKIYQKRGLDIMRFHAENFRYAGPFVPPPSARSGGKKRAPLPADVRVLRDVEYARVGNRSLKLDLYLPAANDVPPPLIVWFHGGAWKAGSKSKCGIAWMTGHGFAVASVDYRLSGEAVFPALVHDCKAAVRWLRAHAVDYGFSGDRIGVAGSSAGGHLAALVGLSADVVELEGDVGEDAGVSSRVQAVMDLYGMTDLYYNATVESARCDQPDCPLFQLLGGRPSQHLDLARQASPVRHVTADDPPVLVLHGTADPSLVRPFQGRFLVDACRRAGVTAAIHLIDGAGHGGPQFSDAARRPLIADWFGRHLKTGRGATGR